MKYESSVDFVKVKFYLKKHCGHFQSILPSFQGKSFILYFWILMSIYIIIFCWWYQYPYIRLSLFFSLSSFIFSKIIFHLNFLNFFGCFLLYSFWLSPVFSPWHPFKLSLFPPSLGISYLFHSTPFESSVLLATHFSWNQDYGHGCEGAKRYSGLSALFSWVLWKGSPQPVLYSTFYSFLWLSTKPWRNDRLQQPFPSL